MSLSNEDEWSLVLNGVDQLRKQLKDLESRAGLVKDYLDIIFDKLYELKEAFHESRN